MTILTGIFSAHNYLTCELQKCGNGAVRSFYAGVLFRERLSLAEDCFVAHAEIDELKTSGILVSKVLPHSEARREPPFECCADYHCDLRTLTIHESVITRKVITVQHARKHEHDNQNLIFLFSR